MCDLVEKMTFLMNVLVAHGGDVLVILIYEE